MCVYIYIKEVVMDGVSLSLHVYILMWKVLWADPW